MPIAKKIDETIAMLKKRLRAEESFDLIYRTMTIGGKGACLFFIDGLVKDEVMEKIMEFFYSAKPEDAGASRSPWSSVKSAAGSPCLRAACP